MRDVFSQLWVVGRHKISLLGLKAEKVWEPLVYWYEDCGDIISGDQ